MTSVPKNVYIDKVDDVVDKYSYTCQRTIKMKHIEVKSTTYETLKLKMMIKILNLKFLTT